MQIVALTGDKGANIDLFPTADDRTEMRTKEDKARGIGGGFFTDVLLQEIASDRFDDADAEAWADPHDRLERYRPDAGSQDRAVVVGSVRA